MKLFTLFSLLILSLTSIHAARGPTARRLRRDYAPQVPRLARRGGAPAPIPGFNITVPTFGRTDNCTDVIAPKVFILSLFSPEAAPWYSTPLGLGAINVTVPGLSPLFQQAHCNPTLEVCQIITGEAEVNAAASVSAIVNSPFFDLRKTYFFEAGIAGVNPKCATEASAMFARFAVQIDLEYEIDAREIPDNYTTGWVPFGAKAPGVYPSTYYGSEIHEFNIALRKKAIAAGSKAKLNDSDAAIAYRARYPSAPANAPPSVLAGDVVSSNVYFSGTLLGEAFENYTTLLTNGTGFYCATAEEDNAVAEAVLRGTLAGRADYGRLIVMRTASDFDRPPPGVTATQNLFYEEQGGFPPAIVNIGLVGIEVVNDILANWDSEYEKGIPATNYLGNLFNSFNLPNPDIGSAASYAEKNAPGGNTVT